MAQAPIISPTPAQTLQPWLQERAGIAEASSGAFVQGQFVRTSGSAAAVTLAKCPDGTSAAISGGGVYGLANRTAGGTAQEPYLSPTANIHLPIDVVNDKFWINTIGAQSGAVGTGSATALVTGSQYELGSFTSSGYSGIHALNAASAAGTGKAFFVYEGIVHPDDAAADTNARVLVSVLPAAIQ